MYLHIGKDIIVKNEDIIGIFNIKYIRNTKEFREMYRELNDNIINISDEKVKTFIITERNKKVKGYMTKISVNTITKRLI